MSSKNSLQTLDRTFELISILGHARMPLTATELSKRLGMQRTAIYTMLNTMIEHNYIEKDSETGGFILGHKIFEMGMLFRRRFPFLRVVQSFTANMMNKWAMGTHVSIYINDGNILLLTQDYPPGIRVLHEGSIVPAYTSASGRVLLASLPDDKLKAELDSFALEGITPNTITDKDQLLETILDTRQKGYAVEDQEYIIGVSCFAAPIKDEYGKIIAALGMFGETDRVIPNIEEIIRDGVVAARSISIT